MTDEAAQVASETQGADPAAGQASAPAPDFSWLPADYLKDGQPDLAGFSQHYATLAADAAARADAPRPPEDGKYAFTLPADFKADLPEGVHMNIGVDDPAYADLFTDLGAFMHKTGLPQDAATNLMGLLGRYKATEIRQRYAAAQEDYAKLGPTPAARDARMTKLSTWINDRLPADQAKALMDTVKSSAAVIALERLQSQNLGPQAAPQSHPNQALQGLHGSALLKALPIQKRA